MSFCQLPSEIIEEIIGRGLSSPKDITNFAATCKRFWKIGNSNSVWRVQFEKNWPSFCLKIPDENSNYDAKSYTEYFQITGKEKNERYHYLHKCLSNQDNRPIIWRYLFEILCEIKSTLNVMEYVYYPDTELEENDFKKFNKLNSIFGEKIMLLYLYYIIESQCNVFNLTEKYYAKKVLRYYLSKHLKSKWQDFFYGSEEPAVADSVKKKQYSSLISGALIFEQWLCPYEQMDDKSIVRFLKTAVEDVCARIRNVNFGHPCLTWDINSDNFVPSPLTPTEQRVVLESVSFVFCQTYGFHKINENGMFYDLENSLLHKAIENRYGIPITQCILFREIALHFGIFLDVINYPGVVMLRHRKTDVPMVNDYNKSFSFYVPSQGGVDKSFSECGGISVLYEDTSNREVLTRMSNNVVKALRQSYHPGHVQDLPMYYVYDQHLIINPGDPKISVSRMVELINNNINLQHIVDNLTANQKVFMEIYQIDIESLRLEAELKNGKTEERWAMGKQNLPKPMHRNEFPLVHYSVGMIAHHRRYNYMCVIRGWDDCCKSSEEWSAQMGVNNLPKGRNQPFYNVLVDDGSERYAAHESLEVINPEIDFNNPISHVKIGQYFKFYVPNCVGTQYKLPVLKSYFMPNDVLMAHYPGDLPITKQLSNSGKL